MTKIFESISVPNLLISIVIVACAALLWVVSKRLYIRYSHEKENDAKSKISAIGRIAFDLVRAIILVMAVIAILDVNGVNVTSLVAGLGLASAVIGLALQDGLKDIIMGTHILSDEFFSIGDVVQYGDIEGTVIFFNIRTTKIKNTADGRILTICNRNVAEIIKMPSSAQVDIDLPLSYEESGAKIHALLSDVSARIGSIEGIISSEYKGTQRFDASAVIYKLRFFCSPEDRFELERRAMMTIQDCLEEAGVRIPYNQIDLHQIS